MFINKEHWKTENIIRGIARISIHQAHFLFWMAMINGVVFIIGTAQMSRAPQGIWDKMPPMLGLAALGAIGFALFFPLSFIIYLAKELQKTKERVEELSKGKLNQSKLEIP